MLADAAAEHETMTYKLPNTITLFALGLLLSGPTLGGEIYRYVDAQGNVHYGDRPSGSPAEERLAIESHATDPAAVQAGIAKRRENDAIRDEARTLRANQKEEAAEKRAQAEQLEAQCKEQRKRLKTYSESMRLYRTDENGEREFLDDEQRSKFEADLRQQIETSCS